MSKSLLHTVGLTLTMAVACSRGETRHETTQAKRLSDTATTPQAAAPLPDTALRSMALPATPPSAAIAPYDTFDFAHTRVDSAAIYSLSLTDARVVRGIVFGRHGRPFDDDADIKAYLTGRPWYKADTAFSNDSLNALEKENLDIIRGAEAAHHPFIEPGDLRFVGKRVVTRAMIGHHTDPEWRELTTELHAMHGHQFGDPYYDDTDDETSLQYYYNHRYWYHRSDTPTELTPAEQAVDDTIALAHLLDKGDHATPGVMRFFQTRPLTRTQLEGSSNMYALRSMRNEFFAMHGHKFETPWLRDRFAAFSYRTPGAEKTETPLTAVEKANVALIQQVETELHDALHTREIGPETMGDMPPAEARLVRNEIYARHGRPFKDPEVRSYFLSQDWYKPNAHFSEASLSPVEKKNAAMILAYEKGEARRLARLRSA